MVPLPEEADYMMSKLTSLALKLSNGLPVREELLGLAKRPTEPLVLQAVLIRLDKVTVEQVGQVVVPRVLAVVAQPHPE
jgi:hypothetical protein